MLCDVSDNIGKWLGVVALAASTPIDNSAEVKKLTAELKIEAGAFETVAAEQSK